MKKHTVRWALKEQTRALVEYTEQQRLDAIAAYVEEELLAASIRARFSNLSLTGRISSSQPNLASVARTCATLLTR